MRIISGNLKGKSLEYLKNSTTRPLKDSVKENIFNIITHSNLFKINLEKSSVLDLYSGIGSFGLECISRGSKNITFVEKDKNTLKILENNLRNLGIENKALIIKNDVINFLTKEIKNNYEIIFFDPPFANTEYLEELKIIKEKKIYKKEHVVIIHREHKTNDDLKTILNQMLIKKYGRSKIIFGKF